MDVHRISAVKLFAENVCDLRTLIFISRERFTGATDAMLH